MTKRTPEELIAEVRKRIFKKEYDRLFSGGCCFHFALRSFRRGIGSLAYTQGHDPRRKGHVFVVSKEGLAFDCTGYQELSAIKVKFGGYGNDRDLSTTVGEIENDILDLGWPTSLNEEIFGIADEIITQKMIALLPSSWGNSEKNFQ